MAKYFGTDGIRGRVGAPHMNPDFAYRLGAALGAQLAEIKGDVPSHVVIGRDTRESGPLLADALTQGLNQHGVYVHDLGIVPTPAIAQGVLEQQADLGIAVTASHNPYTDNGIKLFNQHGHKLSEEAELVIESLIDLQPEKPAELALPKAYPMDGAAHYINYQSSLLDQNCMCGWKIVLDLANGATCETTPAVFRRWGAELVLIGDNPDGENINRGVGSECPEQLGEAVRAHQAEIGIAHDGDGDRLVVCDENGQVIDGDILLALYGVYAMRSGALRGNKLVATIQSNLALDHALREAGGEVVRVGVGDRNVASKMREIGSNIGGESSGHIIFSDFATTGDGLLAAIKLMDLMCKTGKRLSELCREFRLFPQATKNLKVEEKLPLDGLASVQSTIQQIETSFGDEGRVLVRYSGTEPKIRLLVEGRDENAVKNALKSLETAVRSDLVVIDG
ncbi:phosphoglucosamine mutase [Coraliomargarita akajimensis]|uniref:Phosphoglucosamine mutase n=1 Tax=Coraliomargarita akajimensis (strain DSM 45221 / IAM 15411 / JCM 23193 / KCTC 12865 / 04OKA010-24) TaxID=583355 RepID=D5ERC4_CORAD|nr:phosphoglucosamine mutase [Coraliomargarita akajimensis]ADE55968.1 phosphoglucosamine mutase [Coraliomargarita akajimensis DSM 45221]